MEHTEHADSSDITIIVESDRIGDVERACQQAQILRAAGLRVLLTIPETAADRVSRARDSGVVIRTVGDAQGAPAPFPLVTTMRDTFQAGQRFYTRLRSVFRADVVQFTGNPDHFILSAALLKLSGKRVVFDMRRHVPSPGDRGLRLADAAVTAQAIEASGPQTVLLPECAWGGLTPRVADIGAFGSGRRHLVLCACDGGPEDNVDGLMRTLRRILFGLERSDIQFALIAPLARHKELALAARAADVQSYLTLINAGDRAAMSRAFSTADLALDPTRRSAAGGTFMSSFVECCVQFGLPLVAFKRRVLEERLQEAALFVAVEDVPELADAILDVLDFGDQRAGQRDKMRARKCGYDAVEAARRQYAELILRLIAARRPTPSASEIAAEPEAPAT